MTQLLLEYNPEPEWKSQRIVEKLLNSISKSSIAKPRIRLVSALPVTPATPTSFKLDLSYPSKGE